MFYEGTLQDGILTAVRESKQVVCFVTDDGDESQQWENEFLSDDAVKSGLENQSVVLKLAAGSQEAGFLEQLFPVPKKPTVVVIQDGQLKEYIAAGTSKDEFVRRLSGTSRPSGVHNPQQASTVSSAQTPVSQPTQTSTQHEVAGTDDSLYDDGPSVDIPIATTSSTTNQESKPSASEEETKKEQTAAETKAKARAEAEEEARRRVDERCGCEPETPEQTHANKIKQQKQQAADDRKRVLQRIEDDKRARKEREAEERKARQLLHAQPELGADSPSTSIPLTQRLPKAGSGDHCNLQVRLLDGSTIRSRFPSDKTLNREVRKWIDEERTDGDAPYSFRVVLTPLPNKVIQPEEEIKSLSSLGLAPSATLVLIPTRFSRAYANAGGAVARGLNPIVGVFSTLYGAILASLGGIFAMLFGGQQQRPEAIPMQNLRAARESRIRGIHDDNNRQRDPQLYNGNSLNFEPRHDGDEDST
ncbi:hypothetical protein F5Y16DRAFT_382362 [Xylariaceae sp. FL0255]|nr:hypothetical protein F5Y16DRAFT_382362 [Xylariaceae sp. FL0255]